SQSVKKTEKELGVEIFHRSRSGMTLTNKGYEIVEESKKILNKIEKLKKIGNNNNQTKLTIGTPTNTVNFLSKGLASLKIDYPNAQFYIKEERNSTKILHDVVKRNLDLGIVGLSEVSKILHKSDVEYYPLSLSKMVILASVNSSI